jgi:aminoglycoside 6'-N-acetyltransferase I
MTAELATEPVGPAALPAACALLIRFFREEGFATAPDGIARNLEAMLEDPSCWLALARSGGAAAGIVTVSIMRMVEHGLVAELGDLYVLPEHRGRGVARSLVAAAASWSRARGCSAIVVTVTPEGEARHRLSGFYDRLGFATTGRTIRERRLS